MVFLPLSTQHWLPNRPRAQIRAAARRTSHSFTSPHARRSTMYKLVVVALAASADRGRVGRVASLATARARTTAAGRSTRRRRARPSTATGSRSPRRSAARRRTRAARRRRRRARAPAREPAAAVLLLPPNQENSPPRQDTSHYALPSHYNSQPQTN